MTRLTWADLLTDDITPDQFRSWLDVWSGTMTGSVAPVFLSKFGLIFLRRTDDQIEVLNVFSGKIEPVAESYEKLVQEMNEIWWQEVYLLSPLVLKLHEAGKVPGPNQCYALAPHPALGGKNPIAGDEIDPRFVMIMDIDVWQSICAQAVGRGRGIG